MKNHSRLIFFSLCFFCLPMGSIRCAASSSFTSSSSQELSQALFAIGVSSSDIGQMNISGTPPSSLVSTFAKYAKNSDNKAFNGLTSAERNSLIPFAFQLKSQDLITNDTLQSLMTAEKLRTGMPLAHIQEIEALAMQFKDNPNYVISTDTVNMVGDAASYININPYAFADVLGTIIGPILNQNTVTVPDNTQQILVNAAKTLSGLSQDQIDNIQDISDNYQSTGQFDATAQNVNDMNQMMATSYYPDSAYLLLPFVGADALITAAAIGSLYPATFDETVVNHYHRDVYRNPVVQNYHRDGVYPRYNNNWANRAQRNGNAARARAQDRGLEQGRRAQDRGAGVDRGARAGRGGGPRR